MSQLWHPLVVHFPIALWITSALFDLLYLWRGEAFHARAAKVLIGLGLLGALVAVGTGYLDLGRFSPEELGPAFLGLHRTHQAFAVAATLTYAASFAVRLRRTPGRGVVALLALTGAVLIGWAAWLGGELRMRM